MILRCLIIDDEPIARKGLEEYVGEVEFLTLVGQCENPVQATAYLDRGVDLIFLDIHMPKLSGIEFIKTLKDPPMIIFTTAYSEHALEGYTLDVIDYLLKPISFDRFLKAVNKAHDFLALQRRGQKENQVDYFFIKCDSKFEKVFYREILYLESMQNYVVLYTLERKLITYMTLSGLEALLPKEQFIKVHKSYVVSIAQIRALEGNEVLVRGTKIPISRNLKDEVVKRILGDNLFSR